MSTKIHGALLHAENLATEITTATVAARAGRNPGDRMVPGMSLLGVEQTFCINLDHQTERNVHMVKSYPFAFQFMSAVYRPSIADLQARFPNLTDAQAQTLSTTSGEWGASFSHFNTWEKIQSLSRYGMVLEDDIVVHDAVGLLDFTTNELPAMDTDSVGIIYVGGLWVPGYGPGPTVSTLFPAHHIPLSHCMRPFSQSLWIRGLSELDANKIPSDLFNTYHFRTPAAMIIHPRYAATLVKKVEAEPYAYFRLPVDNWLIDLERQSGGTTFFDRFPHPIYQMMIDGDIQHENVAKPEETRIIVPGLAANTIAAYHHIIKLWGVDPKQQLLWPTITPSPSLVGAGGSRSGLVISK